MPQHFAIAILSYNHPDITAKCVRSVLNLHNKNQVYLTHNGSLPQHIHKLKEEFPDIQHIEIQNNKGYTHGVNTTLSVVFQKFHQVLFLTNDTELIQINPYPKEGFHSIEIRKRKSNTIDSIMGALNPQKGSLRHLKNRDDLTQKELCYVPGTAFWMSKNVFDQVGFFDENFHTYWEDVDYSLRAQKLNFKIESDSQTICMHKIGKTCHKDRFYTFELFQRNRGLCLRKNNLLSIPFYFYYIKDLIKFSKSDYKLGISVFLKHIRDSYDKKST